MSLEQLYRQECLDSAYKSFYGESFIPQPKGYKYFALFSIVAILAVCLVVLLVPIKRTVIVEGIVQPEQPSVEIKSVNPGIMSKQFFKDGELVKEGDKLLEIHSSTDFVQLATEMALLDEEKQILTSTQEILEAALNAKLKELTLSQSQQAQLMSQLERVKDIRTKMLESHDAVQSDVSTLVASGTISRIDYERELRNSMEYDIHRIRSANEAKQAQLKAELLSAERDLTIEEYRLKLSDLEYKTLSLHKRYLSLSKTFYATQSGLITYNQNLVKGQYVKPDEWLFTITPETPKQEITALIPPNTRALLGKTVSALIQLPGIRSSEKWHPARINITSESIQQSSVYSGIAEGIPTSFYRGKVGSYDDSLKLTHGMRVNIKIIIAEQPLFHQLFNSEAL
ncbi:HlyD family efflux transporter periplasmic adaptor subunit [Paraneptunicella aestuarii]|uniref:HlyD family secretion protein n=1 Tax=Paraneptunicella aestuarii TaxID=2831148 RepID=UPI001E5C4B7D|nr:HlyD family secretion protein [Paraneptunicella aestuarii]UAA38828.1 HlyD family efflux transporter periplasmic adaptor subunit [Paraneptunicella aestuarii]